MNPIIRPYVLEDVVPCYEAVMESKERLAPWMPWCHPAYAVEDSRGWVESQVAAFAKGTEYAFVITDAAGRILGGCGLNHFDHANRRANLGYWVRTAVARQGVATAAVHRLVEWAFANTDFCRLEILAAVGNLPSQGVAERAGAVREGVQRARLLLNSALHDAVMFSITRPLPGAR